MKITVQQLIDALKRFHPDSRVQLEVKTDIAGAPCFRFDPHAGYAEQVDGELTVFIGDQEDMEPWPDWVKHPYAEVKVGDGVYSADGKFGTVTKVGVTKTVSAALVRPDIPVDPRLTTTDGK